MIYICKLFSLFVIPPISFPIFSSGYFYFLLSFVCVPGWLIFCFFLMQPNKHRTVFLYMLFVFLIEYICMLLFDESIEQSLLSMISIFTYIYISFSCSLYRLLIFRKKKSGFVPITSVFVCIFRKKKNRYICFVLFCFLFLSVFRVNDEMIEWFLISSYIFFSHRVVLYFLLFCMYLYLKRGKRTVVE